MPTRAATTIVKPVFLPPSDLDRILDAARRALPLIPREARLQLASLLTPQALTVICGLGAAWGAAHWVGLGEAVDLALLGVGAIAIGTDVLRAAHHFHLFYDQAKKAASEAELDAAGVHFARGVAIAGIDSILVLVARIPGARASAGAVADSMKVEASAIAFPTCENGALWSRLDAAAAEKAAAADGLTTLEATLRSRQRSFYTRLTSLQEVLPWDALQPVWRSLSRSYAGSLRGKVTVYVDLPSLLQRVSTAERIDVAAGAQMSEGVDLAKNPILIEEIDVVTDDIINTNPNVEKIIVKDIKGRMGGFIIDKRYGTTH